jgi:predicted nucleic acid-binding protein
MIKIFLDTNVVMDFLEKTRIRHIISSTIVRECLVGNITGCISETGITNCSYLLRKTFNQKQQNEIFSNFSKFLNFLGLTSNALEKACKVNISDIEDAILYQIALENDCAFFITSNVEDFASIAQPSLKVVSPAYFLEWYEKEN